MLRVLLEFRFGLRVECVGLRIVEVVKDFASTRGDQALNPKH